jgi:hypothetical protein
MAIIFKVGTIILAIKITPRDRIGTFAPQQYHPGQDRRGHFVAEQIGDHDRQNIGWQIQHDDVTSSAIVHCRLFLRRT